MSGNKSTERQGNGPSSGSEQHCQHPSGTSNKGNTPVRRNISPAHTERTTPTNNSDSNTRRHRIAGTTPHRPYPYKTPPRYSSTNYYTMSFKRIATDAFLFQALTKCPFHPDPATPFHPSTQKAQPTAVPDLEHLCCPVIHPTTGEIITKYQKLANDTLLRETWTTALGKEFGSLAQGDKKPGAVGTNSLFVMDPATIPNIPKDRTITYGRIVVDYRAQQKDPNRVRITAGGNLIKYPGELTTRTADLITSKILWNSVLSTAKAKFMCIDIKNFDL